MIKKKISFSSVNFRQGPKELNAYFLPYSVAVLWAYAKSIPHIDQQWQLDRMLWRRDDIESTAQELCTNHLVAFSTYIWNRNYNYGLARRIKELNPDVVIVFGGPEPAVTDPEVFVKHPYIDIIIKLEGEITMSRVLAEYDSKDWKQIPGLVYNDHMRAVDTGEPDRITDLSVLPSPYLTGLFDDIVRNNPGYTWNATLETNRGCPYQCTFCDWGSLTYNKIKVFPLEKVFAEIDWIADNAGFIYVADANFGIFVDRDSDIIDHIIRSQQRTGNHYPFYTNWAKNQKAEVVSMINRLTTETNCVVNGLSVSVQSMTPGVLDIIKRSNLNQHKLQEIFELGTKHHTPIFTELILGLPGETLRSWQTSLYQVFEAGNHHGIDMIQCQLLENAEMNLKQRSLYRIKSRDVMDYMSQTTDTHEGPVETIAVVTETSSMARTDMLEAQVWSSFMHLMHIAGFSTQISRYLRRAHDISYEDFYDALYEFARQDPYFQASLQTLRDNYDHWMQHGYLPHPVTQEISQTGVNLITSLLLLVHLEQKIDHVHDLIESYVDETYDFLAHDLKRDLYAYQRAMIVRHQDLKTLPRQLNLAHDFLGYLDHQETLYQPCRMLIDFKEGHDMSYNRFHENLYYGRKRGFGKSQIKKVRIT